MMIKLEVEHFTEAEIACKCCAGFKLNNRALILLQALRYMCDFPIRVSSGYRCPSHNKKSGGMSKSSHVLGTGFDIKVKKLEKSLFIKNCLNLGFSVGIYDKHTHIDMRRGIPKIWWGKSS